MTLFEKFTTAVAASEDLSSVIDCIKETEFGVTYIYDTFDGCALVAEGKGGDRVFDYSDVPVTSEGWAPGGAYTSWSSLETFINMLKGE